MSENPWLVDLSPERATEGWYIYRLQQDPNASQRRWAAVLCAMHIRQKTEVGYGPTPAAALADGIRKAKEAT